MNFLSHNVLPYTEKSESESCLVVSYSFQPHGLYMGPFPSPGDLPNPGIFPAQRSSQPRSPTLQTDSLPAEPPEKPKNTGMGSLSLLQQIFLVQELTRDLQHCRQILYQLSYQGSFERFKFAQSIGLFYEVLKHKWSLCKNCVKTV